MPAVLVVTTDVVPGYQVTSVIGQVVGSVARLSNAFTEGIRTMDGQLNPHRGQDLAQWRTDAVNAMVEEARKKGANAVIGTRFDNRLISTAWAEICAYGTAVRVDPQDGHGESREGQPAPVQPPRAESPVVPPAPARSARPEGPAGPEPQPGAEPSPESEAEASAPPEAEASAPPEAEAEASVASQPEAATPAAEAGPELAASATGWPEGTEVEDRLPSEPRLPTEPQPRSRSRRREADRPGAHRSEVDRSEVDRSEEVGPERLRPEEPDPDWPDTPTDPSLRMPD
jgi:uncharacterized protein YbjQ (UPF0145 family)